MVKKGNRSVLYRLFEYIFAMELP